jgi:hypothetical protein
MSNALQSPAGGAAERGCHKTDAIAQALQNKSGFQFGKRRFGATGSDVNFSAVKGFVSLIWQC